MLNPLEVGASPGDDITVNAYKYDGRIHRSWRARVTHIEGSLVVLDGVFDEEIRHDQLGTIVPGTLSTEYYWTDRYYNIFRFRQPSGALRNYYCNVNLPARFDNDVLSFIDLDMDVLVAPDFTFRVLDIDEFQTNAARYGYPPEIRCRADAALADLITLIETRQFPFSVRV